MSEAYQNDVTIIGGGPGGYAAAILAARLKARVTLIEQDKLGGTCLNVGCIPTKALLKCAEVYTSAAAAGMYGVTYSGVGLDFRKMAQFKDQVTAQLVGGVSYLVKANQVNLIQGTGKLVDAHTVAVETAGGRETVTTRNLIIATGAKEIVIPGFAPDGDTILNSTQMLALQTLPRRLAIIGGGVIGVEFASLFSRLGVEVTIVELTPRLIPTEDEELSQTLKAHLEQGGVTIHVNTKAQNVVREASGALVVNTQLADGTLRAIACDKLLVCVGRSARLQEVGAAELGVVLKKGRVETDAYMQTSVPGVYAIGDVTLSEQLAHVAYQEARTAVFHMLGRPCAVDYSAIPHCIYTTPEVADVGLSEEQARALYPQAQVAHFPFSGNGKAMIEGHSEGFVKLIFNGETEEILGAAILGPKATELITEMTLAVRKKLKVMDIVNTVHAHPTLSEALSEAALAAVGLKLHAL